MLGRPDWVIEAKPLSAIWPIGARSLSAIGPFRPSLVFGRLGLGPFRPSLGRMGTLRTERLAPSPRHDRFGMPKVPHLRTLGRSVRRIGTLLVRVDSKVPNLRTRRRTVRKSGTLASLFYSKVPYLRTHGRTVRNSGTLASVFAAIVPKLRTLGRTERRKGTLLHPGTGRPPAPRQNLPVCVHPALTHAKQEVSRRWSA